MENFTPQSTADGSFTFFSQEFNELFHSHYGARQESFLKFCLPSQLALKSSKGVLRILDICYGLGYNTAAALQTIWTNNPDCFVEVIALELNSAVPQAAISHNLFNNWDYEYVQILTKLANSYSLQTERLNAKLLIGDARKTIQEVYASGFQADAIFLDPFSPPQCPHLWSVEFIKQLTLCLHLDGILVTYSCAAGVRAALLNAGLAIGSTSPVGRKTPGTVAIHSDAEDGEIIAFPGNSSIILPLSQAEKEHLQTRAAIPYRDPDLKDNADVIIQRRQQEQKSSSLEPTSHWRKRWQFLSA
jgi:tRNA U34 5-methylaminomethyl-2-thiouridine-forming methyltransferase MnmC